MVGQAVMVQFNGTASTMDFLLIGRNEDCSEMWITITDINGGRADALTIGKLMVQKVKMVAISSKITANTWYNQHNDVGDFCTILGSTNNDNGKVTLVESGNVQ